jgi:hypothetical protein
LSGTCIVALAYEKLCLLSLTAALSCFVMSIQLRLLAKAPGSLRPSLLEVPIGLAGLAAPAGLDELADPVLDDAAADGEVGADDPIAAETVGTGPLLAVFEVHALSKASATHPAVAAVATARRWRWCDKVGPVSTVARGSTRRLPGSEELLPG